MCVYISLCKSEDWVYPVLRDGVHHLCMLLLVECSDNTCQAGWKANRRAVWGVGD